MTDQPELNVMNAALTALAGEFTDQRQRITQDGEVEIYNGMAYVQRRMLNGICYTAEKLIEEQHEQMVKARAKLSRLMRETGGDEIGTKAIEDQTVWVERLQLQIAVLNRAFAEAKAVHFAELGEHYVPYRERTRGDAVQAAVNAETNPARARAAALLAATASQAPRNPRVN